MNRIALSFLILFSIGEALTCSQCNGTKFTNCQPGAMPNCPNSYADGVDHGTSTDPIHGEVDWDFILCKEGMCLCAYIPLNTTNNCEVIGQSDITLGGGIDIGTWTKSKLESVGVSKTTLDSLQTLWDAVNTGFADNAAKIEWLDTNPIDLTQAQADEITDKVKINLMNELKDEYNNNTKGLKWDELPLGLRTAMTSTWFNFGKAKVKNYTIWDQWIDNDWEAAIKNWRNWNGYPNTASDIRRTHEAEIAAASLRKCSSENKQNDLVIVLDESGSIDDDEFAQAIDFVKRLVSAYKIGPTDTQVAFMTYASDPRLHFDLDDMSTKDQVLASISAVVKDGGGTRTAKAINMVATDILTTTAGMRTETSIQPIVVVLTDGRAGDSEDIPAAVNSLPSDTTRLAIGIGNGIDHSELRMIASKDKYVNEVTDFDALIANIAGITEELCYVPIQTNTASTVQSASTQDNYQFFSVSFATGGITIQFSPTTGDCHLYASFSDPNPTEFSWDFRAERKGKKNLRIDAQMLNSNQRRLQSDQSMVYYSVLGKEEENNSFSLDIQTGLTCDNGQTVTPGQACDEDKEEVFTLETGTNDGEESGSTALLFCWAILITFS